MARLTSMNGPWSSVVVHRRARRLSLSSSPSPHREPTGCGSVVVHRRARRLSLSSSPSPHREPTGCGCGRGRRRPTLNQWLKVYGTRVVFAHLDWCDLRVLPLSRARHCQRRARVCRCRTRWCARRRLGPRPGWCRLPRSPRTRRHWTRSGTGGPLGPRPLGHHGRVNRPPGGQVQV
jgi:hypothetical protein